MIGCSGTRDYQLTFSLTQCWSGLRHIAGMNTCTQIYAHRNTWCKAYPMKTKEEAHHSLSLLFLH